MKAWKILTTTTLSIALLSGCGADIETMSSGLAKQNQWSSTASSCYADNLAELMESEHFNYMAKLVAKGVDSSDAVAKVRRKFGVSYMSTIRKDSALKACVEG